MKRKVPFLASDCDDIVDFKAHNSNYGSEDYYTVYSTSAPSIHLPTSRSANQSSPPLPHNQSINFVAEQFDFPRLVSVWFGSPDEWQRRSSSSSPSHFPILKVIIRFLFYWMTLNLLIKL